MTTTSLDLVVDALLGASLAGAVVALGCWAVVAVFGRLPAAARCTLWWLVSLKLLVGLAAIDPVAVPALPQTMAATSGVTVTAPGAPTLTTPQAPAQAITATVSWRAALGVVWLGGLVVATALALRAPRIHFRVSNGGLACLTRVRRVSLFVWLAGCWRPWPWEPWCR